MSTSVKHLQEYLDLTGKLDASETFPFEILSCPDFKAARKAVGGYREELMKRWGDQRWCLHNYKSDQIGAEYESALALRALQAGTPDIDKFIEISKTPIDKPKPSSCSVITADSRTLFYLLRMRQIGGYDKASRYLMDKLGSSDSRQPIPADLLKRLAEPPLIFLGFRLRAMASLAAIILGAILVAYWLRRNRKQRPSGTQDSQVRSEYSIDKADPYAWTIARGLGLGPLGVFLLGLVFFGGSMGLLAWSENVLWPSSCVVDRAFLDYLSFPYSFTLLIPTFMAGTLFLYRLVPQKLPEVLGQSFPSDAAEDGNIDTRVRELWKKYARICNSRGLTVACIALAIAVILGQKLQWTRDPGTAFVDLRYPQHWSLTGAYFTVAALLIYYCVLSCLFRGAFVLSFIGKVYSRRWRSDCGVSVYFDPDHPDKCAGTQPIGWMLLLFYVLLLLLAAQVLLNTVEKLRFYESIDIVFQNTYLSVIGFGAAFLVIAPLLVGRPLISIHLTMRRFRRSEGLRLGTLSDRQRDNMLSRIDDGTVGIADTQAFTAITALEKVVGDMPLLPFDLKVAFYFVASHVVPLSSFLLPVIEQRLGAFF